MHSHARLFPFPVILAAGLLAQEAPPAETRFTSRDAHQGVTIAARPLAEATEAEALFGKAAAPVRGGLLAVELLVVNEREAAIGLNLERITLLRHGGKFPHIRPAEAALLLYPLPEVRAPVLGPQPSPRSRVAKDKKRKEREEAEASLASRRFRTASIPPGGQARGFLYFDLGEAETELAGMQLYIPEVDDSATGEGLLYFELALAPADKP